MIRIAKAQFRKLREDWNSLTNSNKRISPYNEYDFIRYVVINYYLMQSGIWRPVFYRVYDDDKLIMILPLARRVCRHGFLYSTLGAQLRVPNEDFIYPDTMTIDCMKSILNQIGNMFGTIHYDFISENTLLYQVLIQQKQPDYYESAVSIHLDTDYTSYFASLSKSTRQNIRTAYNRLTTDNKTFDIQCVIGGG